MLDSGGDGEKAMDEAVDEDEDVEGVFMGPLVLWREPVILR